MRQAKRCYDLAKYMWPSSRGVLSLSTALPSELLLFLCYPSRVLQKRDGKVPVVPSLSQWFAVMFYFTGVTLYSCLSENLWLE